MWVSAGLSGCDGRVRLTAAATRGATGTRSEVPVEGSGTSKIGYGPGRYRFPEPDASQVVWMGEVTVDRGVISECADEHEIIGDRPAGQVPAKLPAKNFPDMLRVAGRRPLSCYRPRIRPSHPGAEFEHNDVPDKLPAGGFMHGCPPGRIACRHLHPEPLCGIAAAVPVRWPAPPHG